MTGVQDWTYTAAQNITVEGINIAENCPAANINNAIRAVMSDVMQEIAYQGSISASASMSLAGVSWRGNTVSGSASIIHAGTGRDGLWRVLTWPGPSTIVASANLLTDAAANILTATGDVSILISRGSGAWRVLHFPIAGATIPDGSITTAKLATDAVTTVKIADNNVTFAKLPAITDGHILGASGGTAIEEISLGAGLTLASNTLSATGGKILQVVKTVTGTMATGTAAFPFDNTIPQQSEGVEFMTLAVTPIAASSTLQIDVVCNLDCGTSRQGVMALFKDSTADAIAATLFSIAVIDWPVSVPLRFFIAAGSTSAQTFKVRAGMSAISTMTFNGMGGSAFYGGVLASSITITEIAA